MIKILIKAFILICIILSIYFIVNPSACSNLMSGRVVNSMEKEPTFVPKDKDHSELLTPTGDQPLEKPARTGASSETPVVAPAQPAETAPAASEQPATPAVTDTNTLSDAQSATPAYTQTDKDYAIASRYVKLENEYIAKKKDTKNAAKEISYIVMDDFQLTPSEWEDFLQRATLSNLFEKVRTEQAAKK